MKHINISSLLLTVLFLFGTTGCEEDEASPVKVNFTNTEAGISKNSPSANLKISFSRPVEADGSLSISISSNVLIYGESADFYTSPLATEDLISLPYAMGDESVMITVSAGSALNIEQDESITITVTDESQLLELGNQTVFTIVFSENFIAPSGTAVLDAGGAEFSHQSYFDLSKLSESKIDKYTWDLGFSTGDEFRVIINNGANMMAQQINKNELSAVTAEDTLGFAATQSFAAFNGNAVDWVDSPDGNLDSLAFNKVAVANTDNKVYILSREGTGRNWKKIRILQNGTGYTLQYADIDSNTFESVDIAKDETYNFTFYDLDNGVTQAEPAKENWDLMYGSFTNIINFGYFLPYAYSDFIIINRHNTVVAEILIDQNMSFDTFSFSDLESLTFSSDQNTIGSNWRNSGGPTSDPSLKEDRFYIIQDSDENIYKLKFTSMYSSENGERGYAGIQYELLQ